MSQPKERYRYGRLEVLCNSCGHYFTPDDHRSRCTDCRKREIPYLTWWEYEMSKGWRPTAEQRREFE